MTEPAIPSGRVDGMCKCGHPKSSHEDMGLSENLIVLPHCRKCGCQSFQTDGSPGRVSTVSSLPQE